MIVTRKIKDFDTSTKIAKECGRFGQINCRQRLWKFAQRPINRPIWSHYLQGTIWWTFWAECKNRSPIIIATWNFFWCLFLNNFLTHLQISLAFLPHQNKLDHLMNNEQNELRVIIHERCRLVVQPNGHNNCGVICWKKVLKSFASTSFKLFLLSCAAGKPFNFKSLTSATTCWI